MIRNLNEEFSPYSELSVKIAPLPYFPGHSGRGVLPCYVSTTSWFFVSLEVFKTFSSFRNFKLPSVLSLTADCVSRAFIGFGQIGAQK